MSTVSTVTRQHVATYIEHTWYIVGMARVALNTDGRHGKGGSEHTW